MACSATYPATSKTNYSTTLIRYEPQENSNRHGKKLIRSSILYPANFRVYACQPPAYFHDNVRGKINGNVGPYTLRMAPEERSIARHNTRRLPQACQHTGRRKTYPGKDYDVPSTAQLRTIAGVNIKKAFGNVTHEAILSHLREIQPGFSYSSTSKASLTKNNPLH